MTGSPDDILARLSAGLDREDHLARAAAEVDNEGSSWRVRKVRTEGMYVFGDYAAIPPNGKGERMGLVDDAQTRHIEEQDPARTRRQVEAIRRILAEHQRATAHAESALIFNPATARGFADGLRCALEILASIYADPAEERP